MDAKILQKLGTGKYSLKVWQKEKIEFQYYI